MRRCGGQENLQQGSRKRDGQATPGGREAVRHTLVHWTTRRSTTRSTARLLWVRVTLYYILEALAPSTSHAFLRRHVG